jgi:hypothetical protein
MNIKTILLIGFLIFSHLAILAQKNKEILLKGITGKGFSDCISTSETLALQKAKQEALSKAGIAENVQVQNALEQAEIGDNYSELFSSNVFTQIQGAVSDIEITEISHSITNDMVETNIKINCTVIKYNTQADPHFQTKIVGVNPFYSSGDKLNFKIIPRIDCYVKAWLFTETDAFTLFPNNLEPTYLLSANDTAVFPSYKAVYKLETIQEQEIHRLIIVIMKEDFPYMGTDSYKDISEWVFSLPPDQRQVKYFSLTVTNK